MSSRSVNNSRVGATCSLPNGNSPTNKTRSSGGQNLDCRLDSRDNTPDVSEVPFKAGPMCGSRTLVPQETVVREVIIPASMQKTLIFVVDLSEAKLMEDPGSKNYHELREDLVDAMGVVLNQVTVRLFRILFISDYIAYAGGDSPHYLHFKCGIRSTICFLFESLVFPRFHKRVTNSK